MSDNNTQKPASPSTPQQRAEEILRAMQQANGGELVIEGGVPKLRYPVKE